MKKVFSIFLTVVILTLSFSLSSYAQEPVILSIQDEKVYAGDQFTVNVFISDNSQISGAVVDLNYDNEKLEFISAKEGAIFDSNSNISIRNINNEKSYVRFTYMSGSSGLSAEGIIFSVTFKALETSSGKTNLEITIPNPADFVNGNLEKLTYDVDNSEITILDNISIEITTEPTTDESTIVSETSTESNDNEASDNSNVEANDDSNDITTILMIVLLLVGASLICFGIVFAIKKKKQ